MVSINPLKQKKTMKKYIFMAVAGMLALSSCSNDDNDQTTQNAPRQMTFTAGFGDGATTRATLSDNSVSFNAGDGIGILSAKIRSMEGSIQRYLDYAHRQASTDALTGVGNTTAYQSRINALDGQGDSAAYALALFDVDRLKKVNDVYGHTYGDMVIRASALVLTGVFGAENVYRIGGDEFLAVAEATDGAQMEEKLRQVARTAAGYQLQGACSGETLSLSGGTAVFRPGEDGNFREVFVRTDEAMYRNKAQHHLAEDTK